MPRYHLPCPSTRINNETAIRSVLTAAEVNILAKNRSEAVFAGAECFLAPHTNQRDLTQAATRRIWWKRPPVA